jgi:carbon-monoxide dehydrogenase large subunit
VTDDPRAIRLLQAPRLVHGRGRYLDDLPDDGAVHVMFGRSTHPHAIIKAVDASAALAVAGVLGV